MAIRSRLAGSGTGSLSYAVALPGDAAVGDRVIVGIVNDHAHTTSSGSTGWTDLGEEHQSLTTNHSLAVFTRVLDGGANDSLTVTLTDTDSHTSLAVEWVVICLIGDGGAPEPVVFNNGGGGTSSPGTATVGAKTSLTSGDYDSIIFLGLDNSDGEAHTVTPPTAWGNLTHGFTSADVVGCWSMDESATSVTGFSPSDISFTNQEQWITAHVVVAQAAAGGGGGTTPTVRSASGASGPTGDDPAIVPKPAGLAVGDLMIAVHVGDNDATLSDLTGPAGWTMIASQAAAPGAQPAMKVWQKIATSTETAATDFTFNASPGGTGVFCSAGILAITAGTFNPTTPLGAGPSINFNATFSTSHVAPSLTGITNGLLITGHSTDSGGASSCSYTPPSGMTEHVDTAASPGWTCVEINTLALASTAATGTKTATCTTSRPATTVSMIVNPAPSDTARRTSGFLTLLAA